MNVNNLSDSQINAELLARHSRTSGTLESRRQRLQRFLDFEDQKQRRNEYVKQVRQAKEEEAVDGCPCTYGQEERAARGLMDLRDDAERSAYYMNRLISQVKALEDIVMNLDERIAQMEMPPLAPDSNPNWVYDETITSPYA